MFLYQMVQWWAVLAILPRAFVVLRQNRMTQPGISAFILQSPVRKPGITVEHKIINSAVAICARILKPTCLQRAAAICELSRRAGIPNRLVIGVRKSEGGIAAHAWTDADKDNQEEGEYEEFGFGKEWLSGKL